MKIKQFLFTVFLAFFFMGIVFAQTENADFYNKQGIDYYNKGDYAKAIESFIKAKDIYEKTVGKNHPNYATALNNLGALYKATGDYTRAEQCYLEGIVIDERMLGKNHPDYATSLNNLGELYYSMGDYKKAEKYYLEAKDLKARVLGKKHLSYSISLINLGSLYYSMGDYKRAEENYLEAKDILVKAQGKNDPNYAAILNNLGALYYSMADYKRAEENYLEAKAIRERVLGKNHPDYALSLTNLGALYYSMGDFKQGEQFNMEAKDTWTRILGKNHPYYATMLNNLGALYYSMADYKRAEEYYLEAKAIQEQVLGKNHPDYVKSLNNLGELYKSVGDYKRAEQFFLESKGIGERVLGKDHPYYALALNNLGTLYYSMVDYKRAEPYYLESKALNERLLGKNHPDYAKSLNNLGVLYLSKGDYKQAEPYFLEAKEIWAKVPGKDHPDYTNCLFNLSICYLGSKKYDQALTLKTEAYLLTVNQVNRNFSFLSEQQREAYWALNLYSFELSYSLSNFHPVPASNILNYDSALFSKGLLLRTTNAVRDSIYSSGNKKLIAQYEELSSLRQQISALQQSGGGQEYIRNLETQADALDKSLTQASAAFRELQADLELNWKDVRNSLQAKEAAIEFVSFRLCDKGWTDKTLYAALVLKPGMEAPVWIPLCEEAVLTKLFERVKGKNSLEQTQILYDEYGSELYKAIWQPLEKTLENVTAVYYSPSGLLHKIAFNAIPVVGDTRLMDKYDLYLVSSTREVVLRKNKKSEVPRAAVIYGGILYDANERSMKAAARGYKAPETQTRGITLGPAAAIAWGYLAATVSESEDIRKMFTQKKATANLFSGNNGNEESFKALSGKKTPVIHLATHGFFIEDIEKNYEDQERLERLGGQSALENPLLRSGLLLAGANNSWTGKPVDGVEDGILFADEVARMNLLGTDLVVMSACETGLGTVNNGEGVFGLQRAFKLAGVNTLIMSLWSVSDEATSILMRVFYQTWLSGKSKQDALKEAQKTLRGTPQFSAPFFWAAFVMMD